MPDRQKICQLFGNDDVGSSSRNKRKPCKLRYELPVIFIYFYCSFLEYSIEYLFYLAHQITSSQTKRQHKHWSASESNENLGSDYRISNSDTTELESDLYSEDGASVFSEGIVDSSDGWLKNDLY